MARHPFPRDRQRAVKWAQAILAQPEKWAILDSETTGLAPTDEIIQLAIIDLEGRVVFDSLLRPLRRKSIPAEATAIHGISMEMLRTAPTYREVAGQIEAALTGKTLLIYNADFDVRLWKQTAKFAGVPAAKHEVHVS